MLPRYRPWKLGRISGRRPTPSREADLTSSCSEPAPISISNNFVRMSAAKKGDDSTPSAALGTPASSQALAAEPAQKARSCVICANRKVRCDKQYPCGRCQRAGVTCVLPSIDHRPRWARQLVGTPGSAAGIPSRRSAHAGVTADRVADRLKILESLVQELSGELDHARATSSTAASNTGSNPPDRPDNPFPYVSPNGGRFPMFNRPL